MVGSILVRWRKKGRVGKKSLFEHRCSHRQKIARIHCNIQVQIHLILLIYSFYKYLGEGMWKIKGIAFHACSLLNSCGEGSLFLCRKQNFVTEVYMGLETMWSALAAVRQMMEVSSMTLRSHLLQALAAEGCPHWRWNPFPSPGDWQKAKEHLMYMSMEWKAMWKRISVGLPMLHKYLPQSSLLIPFQVFLFCL